MKKVINIYNQIEEKFCTYTFLIVIVLIFYQVIGRYVIGNAPTWSEELSRYLYVWECWVGISLTQRERRHIQLTFLIDMFPPKVRRISDTVAFVITTGTAIILAYYGFMLVSFSIAQGNVSPALHLPMSIFYLCLPVGCVAFIIRKFGEIPKMIRGEIIEELSDAEVALKEYQEEHEGEEA